MHGSDEEGGGRGGEGRGLGFRDVVRLPRRCRLFDAEKKKGRQKHNLLFLSPPPPIVGVPAVNFEHMLLWPQLFIYHGGGGRERGEKRAFVARRRHVIARKMQGQNILL